MENTALDWMSQTIKDYFVKDNNVKISLTEFQHLYNCAKELERVQRESAVLDAQLRLLTYQNK